ncbi:hypothetical protein RclHR1_10730002 [Rhizophagus clarus]|uniref:Kinase-like domain-containing protein n=1 Tax=Rhizophagus clarus TaxID=94130 RepID=A0A2Z6QEG9_9GLOM|nr:hypothetical protein RclHR1_10730002 [Rhizophagus clarus]GES91396.1 kinase-like domain-containing protein [Rhizophagus clarus]
MPNLQDTLQAAPEILNGTIEVTKSVVELGSKLDVAKGALQVIGNAADSITPFIPLISVATTLISEVISIYQTAEYNKKIISALYDRTKLAEFAVDTLQRRKKYYEDNFKRQDWYDAFNRFVDVLKDIKTFAKEISTIRGYQKYLKSYSIKDKFQELSTKYDVVMKDLNFTMAISNEEQRRYDNDCLMEDVAEMKEFFKKIDGGIVDNNQTMNTVIEELRLMRMSLESGKGPETKPKQITQSELMDPSIPDESDCRGSVKKVVRKCYRTTINVACVPFVLNESEPEERKKKDKQLAILSKLSECTNILKFYGLTNLDGINHLVVEWAQYGNLRDTYEAYDIPWTRKIHIAADICRAITFLHSAEIYHHDLRCENVMLTDHLEPKLAKFDYARGQGASTSYIGDMMKIIHWLCPEKMIDKSSRYNAKCEIFSFGMLLWELTFEKTPYQGWDIDKIQKHVIQGKREKITFGPAANERELDIQQGLEYVIKEAWKQRPQDRIPLLNLFNTLERLQSKYKNVVEQELGLLPQKTLDLDGTGTPQISQISDADVEMELPECEDFTLGFEIDIVIPLEEGIKAHKNREYEKAWECFKYHAENKNAYAKHWMAYYLWEGKHVGQNQVEAAKLFKEAADNGIHDAQLRYAFTLQKSLGKKKERDEFIKYLTMSADDGGNSTAQFNLGDVYYNGKLGIPKNVEKGINYLKLSALQGQPNAIKLLKTLNIDFTTEPKH